MKPEVDKLSFPFNLDSYQDNPIDEYEQLTFQNYYPKSKVLQENAKIIPVNHEYERIAKDTLERMKEMNVESMVATGKINIYPKKNTIDLKKHLGKKMAKI